MACRLARRGDRLTGSGRLRAWMTLVPGIGVTTGTHGQEQLLDAGAVWISDSLDPIAAALE